MLQYKKIIEIDYQSLLEGLQNGLYILLLTALTTGLNRFHS
jgi:hypothetical protein